jgi:uncharacterized Zn finger protein
VSSEGADPGAEPRSAPRCPNCAGSDAEVISLFGSQAMTLQYRCRACGTYFEAVKYGEDPLDG